MYNEDDDEITVESEGWREAKKKQQEIDRLRAENERLREVIKNSYHALRIFHYPTNPHGGECQFCVLYREIESLNIAKQSLGEKP